MLRHHTLPFQDEPQTFDDSGSDHPRLQEARDGEVSLLVVGEVFQQLRRIGARELLAEYLAHGLPRLTGPYDGPYCIEVHHRARGEVTLVQSELGPRHLYVLADGGSLSWGTDLEALRRRLPRARLHPTALREALNSRWCLGTDSLIEGIHQLQPSTAWTFDAEGGRKETRLPWFGTFIPGETRPMDAWADDLAALLRGELETIYRNWERPAVLLSGGLDSALLCAVAREVSPRVRAITPTWSDHDNPELPRAKRAAEHLGIDHEIVYLDANDIARATRSFVSDYGILPRDFWAVVLRATFRALDSMPDVVVHGQGADSRFGGGLRWRRRRDTRRARLLQTVVPGPLRRALASRLPLDTSYLGDLRFILTDDPDRMDHRRGFVDIRRDLRARHLSLFGHGYVTDTILERFWDADPRLHGSNRVRLGLCTTHRCNFMELTAMADEFGFEYVYPYFAEGVTELARQIPNRQKHSKRLGKKPIVRTLFARHFPPAWADEPKLGFPTPTRDWLNGPLHEWLTDRVRSESCFARRALGATVDELSVERDYQLMWTLSTIEDFLRSHDVESPATLG